MSRASATKLRHKALASAAVPPYSDEVMNDLTDTIAAMATAPGEAGISIVRGSGPARLKIADAIFRGRRPPSSLAGGSFARGFIRAPALAGERNDVDEVILLVYRAPHSYTREDVVEIQGHGGRVPAQRILRTVVQAGARPAEPGEFTKRAFLNGRIDLLQAEAVSDLIRAQSDRAAACAIEQLEGRLSDSVSGVYDELMDVAVNLEATLDFADDELPAATGIDIKERLAGATKRLRTMLDTWEEGHLLREGALVVIAGKPNVGKSTLLNAMLGRDRAIVTEVPGTTRDTIEEQVIIEGVPVRLVDTAGLRNSGCRVEREGIQRTHGSIDKADVVLYVVDGSQSVDNKDVTTVNRIGISRCVVILNKTDIGCVVDVASFPGFSVVACSLLNGDDVPGIRKAVVLKLGAVSQSQPHAVISERHRLIIQSANAKAAEALDLLESGREDMIAVAATAVRSALDDLGVMTGRVYSNELMDNIFRSFCIGK